MLTLVLPLVVLVVGTPCPTSSKPSASEPGSAKVAKPEAPVVITSARAAQTRLATTLGEADSIDSIGTRIRGNGREITFSIVDKGVPMQVVARTSKRGNVVSLVIAKVQPSCAVGALAIRNTTQSGSITWLADELASTEAVTRLVVDGEGAVLVTTDDARRYMVMPGRGSGGANSAVEARWAAAWNKDES